MTVEVTFHGACGIVTGSCFEVRTGSTGILIDCGMFQGTKTVKQLNYDAFPFDPHAISAVLLTHAHIDHCGLLPKLRRAGFRGPIVATPGTADLLTYVLPDSGYVQEQEVARLNRRNIQRGRLAVEPIYTRADGAACARRVTPRPLGKWIDAAPGVKARFWDAGHILGSASIELAVAQNGDEPLSLLFSGDIGPPHKALQALPSGPVGVDYLFSESTYGDRARPALTPEQRRAALKAEIATGLDAGGLILIPAFAVERTQELLVDLDWLFDHGELPSIPVFVDSPLAIQATQVFAKHRPQTDDDTHPFNRPNLHFVAEAQSSRKLARLKSGAIIIAGSGMCDAGRIRHHLKNNLSQHGTTLLLVGYQAPGTLGRLLLAGTRRVRIEGEEVAVNARIRELVGYSGHADQQSLIQWIQARMPVKHGLFLVHGEEQARQALAARLGAAGVPQHLMRLPAMGETVALTAEGPRLLRVRSRIDVAAAGASDWHNSYAQTLIALRERLDAMPHDKARKALLAKIESALRAS